MTQSFRVSPCTLPVLVVTVGAALAQVPADPPTADKNEQEIATKDAPATFQTRVNLVMVPVVVRDSSGRPVGALIKENFHLFDKGKPQEIARFSVEKPGGGQEPKSHDTGAAPARGNPVERSDAPERFIVYLFDDLHLSFEDLARSREAAIKQLAELNKTDRVAIYTTSGLNQVDFSDDTDKLRAALLRLSNNSMYSMGGVRRCPDIDDYMADMIINQHDTLALDAAAQEVLACLSLPPGALAQARKLAEDEARRVLSLGGQGIRVFFAAMMNVVRRMTAMPGQRTIVLISPGFLVSQFLQDERDLIERAIKANVVVNTMDARGLWTDPMLDASRRGGSTAAFVAASSTSTHLGAFLQNSVLDAIAYGTGGLFIHDNNDLLGALRQLASSPEYYYVLGFSPQNLKFDGSFHPLKVTVKTAEGANFNIQTRRGYYAPKKPSDAEETAKEEIEAAVFSREELNDLPVELHTQYFKAGQNEATISVLCRMDPKRILFRKADGRNNNVLTIVSSVFDRDGNLVSARQRTVDMKWKDDTLAKLLARGEMSVKMNFSVRPGTYAIRLVVRDSEGQLMSALNGMVAIQ